MNEIKNKTNIVQYWGKSFYPETKNKVTSTLERLHIESVVCSRNEILVITTNGTLHFISYSIDSMVIKICLNILFS